MIKKNLLPLGLLIFSLFSSATAEEYIHVSELRNENITHWNTQYETIRGETISVDVDILIPDVELFPMIEAEYADPSALLPKTKSGEPNEIDEDNAYANKKGSFILQYPYSKKYAKWLQEARNKGIDLTEGNPISIVYQIGQYDLDVPYASLNPYTPNDLLFMVQDTLEHYFSDRDFGITPSRLEVQVCHDDYLKNEKTGIWERVNYEDKYALDMQLWFNQQIQGVPIIAWGYEGFFNWGGDMKKGEGQGSLGGYAFINPLSHIGRKDYSWRVLLKLLQVRDILQQDVPLAPVSKVIQTAEEYIRDGKLRSVDSFRLGYTVWLNNNGCMTLFPTWAIEGLVFEDSESEFEYPPEWSDRYALEYQYLFINAQTGEIIDPQNKTADRAYRPPKLITWKETGGT